MVEVVILEREAPLYAAAVAQRFPDITVHATADPAVAMACCAQADVLVALAHEIPDALAAAMPRLRWIQALTSGIDHLLTLPSLPAGVRITNGRGIHGPQMSELAFLHMLGLLRDVRRLLANQAQARWERWPQRLLLDKTVVIVGLGTISEQLARRCQAFGMRVVGVSDSRTAAPDFDVVVPRARLQAAAAEADFLVVLVPYEPSTDKLIGAAVLAAMKPDAVLINLARGRVVDETALIAALRERRIAGAGLDVFTTEPLPPDSPLWHMDNVIVTPHIGGISDVYTQQATPLVLHNLAAYAAGRLDDMRNVVRP